MVQYCPNCGSTNVHREEQLYKWFCSDCGDQFEADPDLLEDNGSMANKVATKTAPGSLEGGSNPPLQPLPIEPLVVQGEVRDVAQNDGEKFVAIYDMSGNLLIGSKLFDNVEQIKTAFASFKPDRLFAVRVVIPKKERTDLR